VTSGPRLSEVVRAFDGATRLPACLEEVDSLREGRGEAYAVLVVDDGSTDATVALELALARGRVGR
jgi:glycosyltransferase involved in cell wall biosynthesis